MIYNLLNYSKSSILPCASEVLRCYILQENCPHWTAFFVRYKDVVNDQIRLSCFLQVIENNEYLVLRTGCFPYIKYHCSKIERGSYNTKDVKLCNYFLNFIKLANLGMILSVATFITYLFIEVLTSFNFFSTKGYQLLHMALVECF